MTTTGTGNSREGKYCPRCRTMTFRDREVCEHCGHQFRTGLETGLGTGLGASPLDAPLMDEAALHRTMQFTLPPRALAAAPDARPPGAGRRHPDPPVPRRRHASVFALALLGALAVALPGAWGYFHYAGTARAKEISPAGVWETAPAGRASQGARLRLALRDDGGGSFSWAADGSAPSPSGPTPLRWRLDPDGRLVLSIPPPAATTDPISGTLITILDSHSWLWRVDRTQHRLIIGTLSFTEKP